MDPSLECELARALMERYLAGEDLPAEPLRQLEGHVKACKGCRQHLDAKRLELANGLSGQKPKAPAPWAKWFAQKPAAEADGSRVFTKPQGSPFSVKTLGLSIGLAFVLFAMSAVAKDPTTLFGAKADSKLPSEWAEATGGKPEAAEDPKEEEAKEEAPKDEGHSGGHTEKPAVLEGSHAETTPSSDGHAAPDSDAKGEAKPEGAKHSAPAPDGGHEGVTEASEPKADGPKPEPPAHQEASKPEPPKALIVADEGQAPKVKPAPAPRPRAMPRRSSAKRASERRAKPRVRRAAAPRPSTGIRVYDSEGKPLR